MRLWTNHPLVAARQVYLARGFQLVEEEPHHSFGVDLVGQVYELDLTASARRLLDLPPRRPHTADRRSSTWCGA